MGADDLPPLWQLGRQLTSQFPGAGPVESRGYIGERLDADAGLLYLNARYMDSQLGMFLQPDWWEVTAPGVGTNRYAYAGGDPVNGSDPGGNLTYNVAEDIFTSDDGDTIESIAKTMGLSPDEISSSNPEVDIVNGLRVGTELTIPRNDRIETGIAAIRENNKQIYSQAAHYDDYYYGDTDSWFSDGTYKCNLFVGLAVKAGFGSQPLRDFKGMPVAALAGEWAAASIPGMLFLSQRDAAFGDIMAWSNNGTINSLGASGHSAIYMSDVTILDRNGNRYTPSPGGWGAIGASSAVGSIYRNSDYLVSAADGRVIHFTRYAK